jgi:photosystem II stability/assembly factor-like uncharacterized protein
VAGVGGAIGQPGVFYMGMPQGGIWKTTSAGVTWFPIFDSVPNVCSVGSVAVAPSDPNIVYAGTGDMPTGGSLNEGNGLYKSTDAGKTWVHLGLDNSKQIPCILIDPKDPNVLLVAAQGSFREKSKDRGIFRSTDGGQTWTQTLFASDSIGVERMAWAFDHPNVIIATTDRHFYAPGAGGRFGARPDGSTRLYKSTDEGVTWKEIDNDTLPELSGRTSVSVAMNTNSQRMFLVGNFGLYRSDDGGDNWRRMDEEDRRVSNGQGGYNCGVYVNTKDPDTVYVINTCSYISKDGGKTFTGFKGAPGGDDPQQMWLDPTDGNRIFLGMDQGGTITLDGGQNWSSWYNQSTAQVYHISVDNQVPYWVYGTQQDTAAVMTSSRGIYGEITPLDWSPNPGFEFGFIVPDPRNSNVSYANGVNGGGISKGTFPTGQWIDVSPAADPAANLRRSRDQPLVFSETNQRELFAGFQCLMSTTDGGEHWNRLSADQTLVPGATPPKPQAPAAPRPATNTNSANPDEDMDADSAPAGDKDAGLDNDDGQGFQQPATISAIASSSVKDGVIWTGTSNGLIHVTKNHGRTWSDASIRNLPGINRGSILSLDASHQDPATAYVAIDMGSTGDINPYILRTHDYGQTWTKIVDGIPSDMPNANFARFVRADTVRPGLLFAGTESTMYVSFNDGDHWQPLTLNLPTTSFRDGTIHGNDLIVGTYGRGFWVLDDISPLREMTAATAAEPAHLFKPGDALRIRRNTGDDTPFPPEVPHALNPPLGAVIYYSLGAAPTGLSLEISDSSGRVVRHMSSAPIPPLKETPPNPDFWTEIPQPMPTNVGTNRVTWNLRYDSPPAFSHTWEINANPHDTPASPEGPLVPPGVYTLKLTVDGKNYTQTVKVVNDPRSPATGQDIRAQFGLQVNLYDCIQKAWDGYQAVAAMKAQVADALKQNKADDLAKAGEAFNAKLTAVGGSASFGRGFFRRGGPPPEPSFAMLNRSLIAQLQTLDSGDMAPTEASGKAVEEACNSLKVVQSKWAALHAKELPAFNAVLAKYGIGPVVAP